MAMETERNSLGVSKVPCKIQPVSSKEKARQILMTVTTVLAVVAACMVVIGYGAKPSRESLTVRTIVEKSEQHADHFARNVRKVRLAQDSEDEEAQDSAEHKVRAHKGQSLEDAGAPAAGGTPAPGFQVPDPEEAKQKAAQAVQGASEAASKAADDAEKAVEALIPLGNIFDALGWHLDFCCYLLTIYIVYYIWKTEVHWKLLPRFRYEEDPAPSEKDIRLAKHVTAIGTWSEELGEGKEGPNAQDLLWFRLAKGELLHFAESKRVLPGIVDTIMCGCGGNVFAVAVTSQRIIIQQDKRCLFGSTVLTTNEESYFLKDVHKAALHTDGSLNLGICVLHSAEMLSGGFNWIFGGFLIDMLLEWKPALLTLIADPRLVGWINMVPDDVIFLVSSLSVLFGGFLLVALLWFLLVPQSTLEVEMVKQAGTRSYHKKFEFPVLEAYEAYDGIMSGRLDKA